MESAPYPSRPLKAQEYELARWLLENGGDEAASYLTQLDQADATEWRCKCGCPSFGFRVRGRPDPVPGVHTLADFSFGTKENPGGVFIYSDGSTLSGVEITSYGEVFTELPSTDELLPIPGS